ncbi:MAG: hypothetical protein P1V81_10340 [Planctomycetota bacterium]|nr:hypothetical protein [Planctomycetota bacterium]
MSVIFAPFAIVLVILAVIAIPFVIGVVLYNLVRLVYGLIARLIRLVGGVVLDVIRIYGHVLALAINLTLTLVNLLFGRWDKLGESGTAMQSELVGTLMAIYRILVVHPLRFLGLGSLVDRDEPAVPAVDPSDLDELGEPALVFDADAGVGAKSTSSDPANFDGYELLGALPRGGSGARLYVAKPVGEKVARLSRMAGKPVDRVVIKTFSLEDGSTMPQIVRESRALEAARDLGLVFEHELAASRFHYVMPYVPGDDLATVTRDLHQRSGPDGLSAGSMRAALNYFGELLITLERFHQKGLWHKDIKPSNVIVSKGRVHLVDLGLVTPLRSAMTLTTHGTEYFRDPEMVRLAMQGVKVHEVDGVKFDLYSAGALLYSMLENSFPAHGSLSRFSRRVPESLQWVVRRAMADMEKRYANATEMLADLSAVLRSENPYSLKPGELPSMRGETLAFRGWQAGAEHAAFRSHGFEDNLADRLRLVGERVTGAGERVSGRMKRLGARAEAKLQRKAAKLEARAAAKPRSFGHKLGVAASVLLLFAVGFAGLMAVSVGGTIDATPFPQAGPNVTSSWEAYAEDGSTVLVTETYPMPGLAVRTSKPMPVHPGAPAPVRPSEPVVEWNPEFTQPENLSPLAAIGEEAAVLILNDLPRGFAAEGIEHLLSTLEGMHLEVIGEGDDLHDIESVARAKQVVGVSGPGDAAAVSRLEAFLLGAEDLDAIFWLSRGESENEVVTRVITAD